MQKLTAVQVEKAKPREKPISYPMAAGSISSATRMGGDIGVMTTGSPGSA